MNVLLYILLLYIQYKYLSISDAQLRYINYINCSSGHTYEYYSIPFLEFGLGVATSTDTVRPSISLPSISKARSRSSREPTSTNAIPIIVSQITYYHITLYTVITHITCVYTCFLLTCKTEYTRIKKDVSLFSCIVHH